MEKTIEDAGIEGLLYLARACAKARKCKITTISRLSHGDPPALDNLINGTGSITLRKHTATMLWLQDPINWPDGTTPPEISWTSLLTDNPKRKKDGVDTGAGRST